MNNLILAAFVVLLGYYLHIYQVHTLFYSGKLLSLPVWALKMSVALLGFYGKCLEERCSCVSVCADQRRSLAELKSCVRGLIRIFKDYIWL